MKRLFNIICLLCIVQLAFGQAYERLESRANDHYDHAEWSEVISITDRMVRIRPSDVAPYSAALVAAQFLNDIPTENRYLELSQYNRIPIDTLLQSVYERTRLMHNAAIYEGILLNLKTHNSWLAKVFNHYLLDYYAFAHKTDQTIAIADELLHVTPENIRYKKIKADALFYQGDHKPAVAIYENILSANPDDYDALTFLGIYYAAEIEKELNQVDTLYQQDHTPVDSIYHSRKRKIIDNQIPGTIELLKKAETVRPSEYIENRIAFLENVSDRLPIHPLRKRTFFDKLKDRQPKIAKEQTPLP